MYRIVAYLLLMAVMAACVEEERDEPIQPPLSPSAEISGTLPVIHIETEGCTPITSKTVYLTASYWIDPMNSKDVFPVGSKQKPLSMQIRGRGHSSWNSAKKPYKIKLAESRSLIGMSASKHWALLKPSENTVAGMMLGKIMNMAWTPDFRPVEVVLNGDYIGLYFLTETIRIDENRVNICRQQNLETDPELITGGWLVEVDNYRDECQITIRENDSWNLTLRYHSPDKLSLAQSQWLIEEFTRMNAAIYSLDKTSKEWEQYLDVESIAKFFIIQEIMDNPDGFHGSFYLHKDLAPGAKWTAGPLWDMTCYNREKTDYTFRMKVHYGFTPHWIGQLIGYHSFCDAVEKIWRDVYPGHLAEVYDYLDATLIPLDAAWRNDDCRWGNDPMQTSSFRLQRIKTALSRNIDWFDSHLPQP